MSSNPLDEKWVKWVALTTTILAVLAAISSLKSGSYSTRVQLLTATENSRWGYFQAKSIKEHLLELQKDSFQLQALNTNNPQTAQFIDSKIKKYDEDIARYSKEKEDLKTQAEDNEKQEEQFKRQGGNLGIAVMFLQIAIMLSSVGALIKRKELWMIGLAFGAIAIVYVINGFYLIF